MGSNISRKSRKGAEIINDDGVYSRFYLVPDHPDSMDKIENKILSKFKWLLSAKQVPPPSPTLHPTLFPPDHINTDGENETPDVKRGEYQPQGRDGYIQIEFTKKGKWTNARWEPLETALHRHKLAGLNGRPRKLKDVKKL